MTTRCEYCGRFMSKGIIAQIEHSHCKPITQISKFNIKDFEDFIKDLTHKNMKEINKKLYKKDSKGKTRILIISTDDGILTQESGLLDGKKVIHSSESKPKNIGKSNETTSQEQAILEAESKITAKIKEGYSETIEETEVEVILPMLAKSYEKEAHKIDWSTAYVQPKLDGMRCLGTINGKISRKNTVIDTMDHIVINRPGETTFAVDGELYAHGLSFQENMKIIKKIRPETINVKHHLYDIVSDLPFRDRYSLLTAIVANSENVELVPTYKVDSFEKAKKYHSQFIAEGYEGTMIRWGNEGYKINGRSSNLLKFKDFIDNTFEVIDVVPSDKNPEQGVIHCKTVNNLGEDVTFGCGMKFSHNDRIEILDNKSDYIGKIAEIRFFEHTDEGLPRFPVCVGFRLDK